MLDVPFLSQSEDLCGGAAAAMVLRYWGQRGIDADSFASLLDRSKAGIQTTVLVADLQRRGWNAAGVRGSDAALRREIDAGRPVIALISDRPGRYHYVVVVAVTDRAIVFHDPARAPFRALAASDFDRRWAETGRWMATITPNSPPPNPKSENPVATAQASPEARLLTANATSCDALVVEGVARARANDLASAERTLASALGCPGPGPMRELAGVRLLQRRWADAASLASAAAAEDPHDQYLWRLLGTAKFLLGDPVGALRAWNVLSEPKIDLVRIDGLTRTRQRVVEHLMGESRGDLLTPAGLLLARRRLADLSSAFSTRVDFMPVPTGLAELHAAVAERSVLPHSTWSLVGLGLSAAAERDVRVETGSLTGGGESLAVDWRFWPNRPRVAVRLAAPSPWGGVWTVDAATERQPFSINGHRLPEASTPDSIERTNARLSAAAWVSPAVRVGVRGGLDRWDSPSRRTYGTAGGFAFLSSRDDRLQAQFDIDIWAGQQRSFGTTNGSVHWQSSTMRTGHVWVGNAGVSFAADQTPLGAWFGGDTGHVRPVLLRAHPLLDDDGLSVERLGRTLVYASGEAQQWWAVRSIVHLGAAVFVDQVQTGRRLEGDSTGDVDAGVGFRLAAPLLPGVVRVDLAKGLRDGATALSVVYAP